MDDEPFKSVSVEGLCLAVLPVGNCPVPYAATDSDDTLTVFADRRPLVALRNLERLQDDLRDAPSYTAHRLFGDHDTAISYYHGLTDKAEIRRTFSGSNRDFSTVYGILMNTVATQSCVICDDGFEETGRIIGIGEKLCHADCGPALADKLDAVWACTDDVLGDSL